MIFSLHVHFMPILIIPGYFIDCVESCVLLHKERIYYVQTHFIRLAVYFHYEWFCLCSRDPLLLAVRGPLWSQRLVRSMTSNYNTVPMGKCHPPVMCFPGTCYGEKRIPTFSKCKLFKSLRHHLWLGKTWTMCLDRRVSWVGCERGLTAPSPSAYKRDNKCVCQLHTLIGQLAACAHTHSCFWNENFI